ncbi:MAG: MFS transporter [Actinobacteria bacterium]|nr:MFS transporter [Actinomycetota bacterium]
MTGNRAATFQSLRVRNFRLFVAGQLLSGIGTWMQSVAAPWLVLQLTGSGVALGIDVGLTFLPILLFGAWGGVLADRFDNRRLQLLTQVAYAVLSMALWLLVITRVVEVWMVFVISFLMGVVTAVDMPTRQSFYLEMVGRNQLTNAMSLSTATFMGARMVGPALAGVLIGTVGVAPVFLINGISYLAVIVALLLMRSDELQRREPVPARRGQIREGVAYVWRTPALRLPMLLMAGVFMFAFNFTVLLPLLAVRSFNGDAGTYGNLLALFGGGSLAGALIMAARSSTPNVPRLALFAVLLGAVSLAVAAAPELLVAALLMPALGAIGIAFAITGNSTLQLTAADDMRGRVMALYGVIFLGSTPLGGPIAGWVGEHLGPRVGLAGGGIVAIAAGVLAVAGLRASRNEIPAIAAAAPDLIE